MDQDPARPGIPGALTAISQALYPPRPPLCVIASLSAAPPQLTTLTDTRPLAGTDSDGDGVFDGLKQSDKGLFTLLHIFTSHPPPTASNHSLSFSSLAFIIDIDY